VGINRFLHKHKELKPDVACALPMATSKESSIVYVGSAFVVAQALVWEVLLASCVSGSGDPDCPNGGVDRRLLPLAVGASVEVGSHPGDAVIQQVGGVDQLATRASDTSFPEAPVGEIVTQDQGKVILALPSDDAVAVVKA
jgi:hypothetical protein